MNKILVHISSTGPTNDRTLVLARAIVELLQGAGIRCSMPEEQENPTDGDSIEVLSDVTREACPLHVTVQTSRALDGNLPDSSFLEEPLSVLLDTLGFFAATALVTPATARSALYSQIQKRLGVLLGACVTCGAIGRHGINYDQFTRAEETCHKAEADAQGWSLEGDPCLSGVASPSSDNLTGAEKVSKTMDSAPRPMKIYADGLQHAERLRQSETPLKQDPVANAYSHGYFNALNDVIKPLVGHAPGSCEEKLWNLVLELHKAATNPIEG